MHHVHLPRAKEYPINKAIPTINIIDAICYILIYNINLRTDIKCLCIITLT